MKEPKVLIFDDKDKLAAAFTHHFVNLVNMKNGPFYVALSGGSTPRVWFDHLRTLPEGDIPWENIHFFWGDERCVPPDDEDSNYGMTKKHLFDHIRIPEENIHRIRGEILPGEAASQYERELIKYLPGEGVPVFDLIILGMGDDGHTASIFPDQIHLWDSPSLCVVASHPETGRQRVSLTGKIINNANVVAFLVTGSNKAEKVKEIIHGEPAAGNYPAALVKPSRGMLYWFLDREAGQLLNK